MSTSTPVSTITITGSPKHVHNIVRENSIRAKRGYISISGDTDKPVLVVVKKGKKEASTEEERPVSKMNVEQLHKKLESLKGISAEEIERVKGLSPKKKIAAFILGYKAPAKGAKEDKEDSTGIENKEEKNTPANKETVLPKAKKKAKTKTKK